MKNKLNEILSTKLTNCILYLDTKYYAKINFYFFSPSGIGGPPNLAVRKLQFTAN